MTSESPPTERSPGQRPGSTDNENVAAAAKLLARLAAENTHRPLERRARAARRLPPLACGRRDPLVEADHQDWRDRHDLLMAQLGRAPEWQRQRARWAWLRGVR